MKPGQGAFHDHGSTDFNCVHLLTDAPAVRRNNSMARAPETDFFLARLSMVRLEWLPTDAVMAYTGRTKTRAVYSHHAF